MDNASCADDSTYWLDKLEQALLTPQELDKFRQTLKRMLEAKKQYDSFRCDNPPNS
jgi:hypothetical protein